ncbi:MAG: hypothetical protein FWF69_07640 [Firmicutes bacterium]|nr:hypothetical protein [Bacillota bacterium]
MTKEECLLKAIFEENGDDDMPDNYPDTYLEKADYAAYCMIKLLEYLSPALCRVSRLRAMLKAGQEGEKNKLPDIITYNETRMVLEPLARVKGDVDDAFGELLKIYNVTKGAAANVPIINETT